MAGGDDVSLVWRGRRGLECGGGEGGGWEQGSCGAEKRTALHWVFSEGNLQHG